MKFNRLYIKNFKNIKEIEITDFNRVNLIAGDNGNGKSACISAIGFILTNDLDEKLEEYIRWGCDRFEIEAELEHEGHKYIYEIEVGKSTKKRLCIDDAEEFFNSEASKKFAEIVDPSLTKYSCIAEQGKTTQLLFQKPSERLRTIKEILKIDSIFKAVENIKEDQKNIKSDIEKIDVEQNVLNNITYSFMDEKSIKEEVEKDATVKDILLIQEDLKIKYEANKIKVEKYQRDFEQYSKNKKNRDDLLQNIKESEEEIQIHEKNMPDEIVSNESVLSSLQKEIDDFNSDSKRYAIEIKSYEEKVKNKKSIEESLSKIEKDITEIKIERIPTCKFNDETIKQLNDLIRDKSVELTGLNNQLDLAKKGKCPTCGQDYKVSSVEDIEKAISDVKLSDLHAELDNQYLEIKKHNDKVEAQKELSSKRKELMDKKAFYENQLSSFSDIKKPEELKAIDIDEINAQIKIQKDLQKKSKEISERRKETMLLIKNIKDKIVFYNNELVKIGEVIEPEKVEDEKIDFNISYYEDVKRRASVYDQKKAELDRIITFNTNLKKEKKVNDDNIKNNEIKKESLLKEQNVLNETRSVLEKEFSSYLVDKSISNIRDWMNDFFQRTYGRYEVTVEQDKNSVNFFYKGEEGILAPVGCSSGAERDILALANRIALSKIQNLGILITDEIDSQMSSDNSITMYKQLFEQDSIGQFFIITHNEATKEMIESRNDSNVYEIEDGMIA